MAIYFVRHGQDSNEKPGFISSIDTGLTPEGKAQSSRCALNLEQELGKAVLPRIITSPRTRTLETAQILADVFGTPVIVNDVRLLERNCTAYNNQSVEVVFSHNEAQLVAGGMEPYAQLYARLKQVYYEYSKDDDTPIILVSHSGNLRPLAQVAAHQSPDPTSDDTMLTADSYMKIN